MNGQLEEIKKLFISSTTEQLMSLKEQLVGLSGTDFDQIDHDLVNDVFMAMHSISGTAPMVGLETLVPVSRKLEIVFDKIRKSEKNLSEQINVQTIRGIDSILSELKNHSKKIAL